MEEELLLLLLQEQVLLLLYEKLLLLLLEVLLLLLKTSWLRTLLKLLWILVVAQRATLAHRACRAHDRSFTGKLENKLFPTNGWWLLCSSRLRR